MTETRPSALEESEKGLVDTPDIIVDVRPETLEKDTNEEAAVSRWKILRRQLMQRKIVLVGFIFVILFVLFALIGPLFTANPDEQNYAATLQPPGPEHLLGTDDLGRDVLARAAAGARVSLIAGLGATAFAMIIGVPLGLIAGYYRGWLDTILSRATDVVLAFPFLIFAVALAAIYGPSLRNVIIALGVAFTPSVIRVTRGEVMGLRELDYVSGAVADGARDGRILFRYILPNALNPLIVQASIFIPTAIIGEAALTTAQPYLASAVWLALVPGLMIVITTLAFNLVGDGIRDVLDPRSS